LLLPCSSLIGHFLAVAASVDVFVPLALLPTQSSQHPIMLTSQQPPSVFVSSVTAPAPVLDDLLLSTESVEPEFLAYPKTSQIILPQPPLDALTFVGMLQSHSAKCIAQSQMHAGCTGIAMLPQ